MDFSSKIINILPHGSGIDYDWQVTRLKNGKVKASNAYHRMDANGFYNGILPFSVTFSKDDFSVRFHGLNSTGYYFVAMDGLRGYLEDLFAEYWPSVVAVMD